MSSTFDPDQFLAATFTDANDTTFDPLPEGEYPGVVNDVKFESGTSQKDGKAWARLDVFWNIDAPQVAEQLGRKELRSKQGIMLDVTETGLDMGKGKNIGLGRLRAALGLNTPGEPFSFNMIKGRAAKVKISHRLYEGKIFDEVKGVAPL